jgi:hypothetical protein
MTEATQVKVSTPNATAGWYILVLAWLVYGGLFFTFSHYLVKPASDITNTEILHLFGTYTPFVGFVFGFLSFLVTGAIYLIVRAVLHRGSRAAASFVTVFGYAPWVMFGWDLVYREPRYVEIARAMITYLGKPMLYSAETVCGLAVVVAAFSLMLKKRSV